MRLAFSTNAFKRYSLEQSVELIAKAGFSAVEILCDTPHLYPPLFSQTDYDNLSNVLRDNKIDVANLNAFTFFAKGNTYNPSWIDNDPKIQDERINHTINAVLAAYKLNVGNISTEPGGLYDKKRSDREELIDIFAVNLKKVLSIAEDKKVCILIEPEPELIIETSSQMLEFIDKIASPFIGVNFDIGHFHCVGETPLDALKKLYPYVKHVHLEDILNRRHMHLIPGEGEIDFEPVFEFLAVNDYKGYVTVELYPYQDDPFSTAVQSMNYLRKYERYFK